MIYVRRGLLPCDFIFETIAAEPLYYDGVGINQ